MREEGILMGRNKISIIGAGFVGATAAHWQLKENWAMSSSSISWKEFLKERRWTL